MINLICLLCSICLQFGIFGIPYEMSYDDFTLGLMQTFQTQAESSEDPRILYFADVWKTGEVQYFLFNGENGNYEIWFDASKYNSSYSSSVVGRVEDNTNNYLQIALTFNRYYKIVFNPNYTSTLSCSFPNDYGWADYVYCRVYPYTQDSYKYLYMVNGVVNNEGGSPIIYGNYVFIDPVEPENPAFGNLGSLDSAGHSQGGSPIDTLNNNGVSWSSTQGTFSSTGHSIGNVTTPPSADPNSNLELILSGFLGGILNNTNDLLGNTSQLGSVLGGVSSNIIQGTSAIFNAISNINNSIMDFINYIKEPLDQDRISAKLEEVPLYQTFNSLVGFSDSFLSAINSVQDPEHLYLTMDFRQANEPFRRLGLYVFDFTFLDNLKSTWQPILLAILYVTLGVNIFYDLPNIVHGISGLSGGDE